MADGAPSRISDAEALALLQSAPTAELAARAGRAARERYDARIHFVHSRNLNPTNRCVGRCKLCSFRREPDAPDAYVLSLDDVREELERARGEGLTDLHVVGGMIPELDLDYYRRLFEVVREILPEALPQGMPATEIHWLAQGSGLSVERTLERLRSAGMRTLSGGGAELFDAGIRRRVAEGKIDADAWLDVHRIAHRMGIPSNATMLFGHIERDEHLIDHLSRLRALQDETGGFLAAIPLPFQAGGGRLGVRHGPSADRIVRVVALTRIYLDNVPHVRMLAGYLNRRLLGVLMHAGVDDIGGTGLKERIVLAAGAPRSRRFEAVAEMERFVREHGLEPCLTNSVYAGAPARRGGRSKRAPWREALERAEAGERISQEEGIALHDDAPLAELGRVADLRRRACVPGDAATYVRDKNLNLTNVCIVGCRFCAFFANPEDERAYVLSPEEVVERARRAAEAGATQILVQGGLHPDLGLAYYEACLSGIRAATDLWIHSLSPAEIDFLARKAGLSLRETLERLKGAGLQSLPGGGAEILVDEVRERISPEKISSAVWLEVMETAHALGMKSTATMVYGFGETAAERIAHFAKIRALQDRTGGFTAFIPWSFSPARTRVRVERRANGADYLRIVALARVMLDNVPHLQAGWVTEGPELAQLALAFGADDFGGVLMSEEVVSATGAGRLMDEATILRLLRDTGRRPLRRSTQYDVLEAPE